ncbi:MAG: signal peptidase II [Oscillospiraceae bacterium]|nr:signal peptidase II [Oscillospiraceae bacterium]
MLYYLLSICLVGIDQLVKWWVRENISLGQSIPFIPHVMDLTYTQNTGAAFSSFSGMTWLLALVSLGASVVVAVLMARNFFPGKWGKLSLSLILAGAAGNLIDRALLGFVTDMLQTTFMEFAVFNVADICVVAGGFLMAGYVLLRWDKDREAQDDPA